ncbi:MAG: helix-turn-helix domain-containing protein [Bacteroidia bacterium]|nr:helix-turn-helix domain-containing protein [Bacteroidia bacterium]
MSASLFALSLMAYLIAYWEPVKSNFWLFHTILPFSVAVPLSFYLFSKALFDDVFRWKKKYLWLILGIVVLHTSLYVFNGLFWSNLEDDIKVLAYLPPYLISLAFVIAGLFEAMKNYQGDLVPGRIRFRMLFILLSAFLMILTISSLMALQHDELPTLIEFVQKLGILLLVLLFSIYLLNINEEIFDAAKKVTPSLPEQGKEKDLPEGLREHLVDKKVYLEEGLSIRDLADRLDMKEYKLRQSINQELGFRNFNQFINSFRVKDAMKILSDPSQEEKTITEIAFELGYVSISPFNKAFKEFSGQTPRAYRKERLVSGVLENENPDGF